MGVQESLHIGRRVGILNIQSPTPSFASFTRLGRRVSSLHTRQAGPIQAGRQRTGQVANSQNSLAKEPPRDFEGARLHVEIKLWEM
jgi:hypothetical protein